MGGFLGIGGSSAKTDRKTELAGFSDLKNVFNFALPTAQKLESAGAGALGQAGDFFSKLASGNRATVASAVAPVTNAARASGDATKRQTAAFGTSRGGGVASTNQQIDDTTRKATDDAILKAQTSGAEGLTRVGGTELSEAMASLGQATGSAADITKLAGDSRMDSFKINKSMQQDVGGVIEGALKSIFQV